LSGSWRFPSTALGRNAAWSQAALPGENRKQAIADLIITANDDSADSPDDDLMSLLASRNEVQEKYRGNFERPPGRAVLCVGLHLNAWDHIPPPTAASSW
jgi:hypothetical protein